MKALVTGATGFLGQALALRLRKMGWLVTGTGRNLAIGEKLKKAGVLFIPGDLSRPEQIIPLCEGQEIVFHCGALSSPWGPYRLFYESNVLGTRHVIEGCQKVGVKRLVHVSTPSIYFQFKDRINIAETDPLPRKMVNAYARTKWLAEQEVDQAHREGLPVITIRPRALFGPGDNAILPRLLKANKRGWIPLINGGKTLIDVTYVENVVDALLLCVDAPSSALGQKYNITNGEPMLLIDLLEKLFQQLGQPLHSRNFSFTTAYSLAGMMELFSNTIRRGKEPVLTRYTVGVLGKSQTLDISKAQTELGYQPQISIDEGLERFIDWWRKQSCNT
ncbi:NAD-dependent epimerase/dehydratase family protein [Paenactinomyces guangxiensis]|uniref:NAD-dependent epimerase/dehydratase family protein n=1 Tax=Paenactinomyces guangxiensis TaxID=1490290 RepID=A0A7W2A831_9BACL|nr:NAD-dependent epimerase/dehydratase family protein [Paenactinomyces guangxiensis]MBA4493398.1 NAD-dependent epimerase/dehydratase family protein [Paenactinomyces guangxiensis]MBH8590488.1 NAD-dependent epimerase/dehydratase family protein [Paenactinomyces guangxiensis]